MAPRAVFTDTGPPSLSRMGWKIVRISSKYCCSLCSIRLVYPIVTTAAGAITMGELVGAEALCWARDLAAMQAMLAPKPVGPPPDRGGRNVIRPSFSTAQERLAAVPVAALA